MDSYYQKLLAHNPESKAGILNPGNDGFGGTSGFQTSRHPRSLNQQDRSNSAPNVCINNVKSFGAANGPGGSVLGFGVGVGILQAKGPLQVCGICERDKCVLYSSVLFYCN